MDALEAARLLATRIRAEADRIDRDADLGGDLVDAMAEAGLFRMLVPRRLGGGELELPAYLEVVHTVARADASAGWCVAQAANFARNACTYLSPDAAAELFGDPRALVANGPFPGQATSQGDGYRVSGRWNFSTNCKNATWLSAACRVDGTDTVRTMLLPNASAEIVEAWGVAGLRGTGTHHFVVDDVFVPRAHTFSTEDPRREHAPLYRFGSQSVFALGFSTVALATARAALDALADLAGAKSPRAMAGKLRDQPLTQLRVGRAEAELRAARALHRQTVADAWASACASDSVPAEHVASIRLATTHAFHAAISVTDAAYTLGGATAIFPESPLQRPFQDMHAISQHIQARESHFQSVGRVLLGLEHEAEVF
jgi:alkylation response protein AidB-like acyl-CoA dehydrogenase